MPKLKIAIIGGGNMGEALVKGLHKSHSVTVAESNVTRAGYLKKKYQITISAVADAVSTSSVIVLAVKPQDMADVLQNVRGRNQIFISIAAGLTTKFFEKHIGKVKVIRCMPNMPALIGEGITAICAGRYASLTDLKLASKILECMGEVLIVNEEKLDGVTAVSGSGPAYLFLFAEQWMKAAQSLGFSETVAKNLVYATLVGSAHLLRSSQFSAGQLREKVTSKGGTTQAAMDVFLKGKFDVLIKKALQAAKKRSKELAK